MAGELIVPDYQLQLRDQLLGEGSDWDLVSLDGLGVPGMRTSDVPRPIQHGDFSGLDLLGGRTLTGALETRTRNESVIRARMDDLVAAFAPPEIGDTEVKVPLVLRLLESERLLFGRPRRLELDVQRLPFGVVKASFQYVAQDPRWYALAESSLVLNLPVAAGGRTYPRTYPLTYGGGSSGVQTADNEGKFDTFPTWTLQGPLTSPRLENVTVGQSLRMNIVLGAGETLVVDFADRTILLGGTASRYSTLTSGAASWWALAPGENELRLGAGSGSGTASVTWRSAWL